MAFGLSAPEDGSQVALDELDGAVLTSDAARTLLCETMLVLDKNSAGWQLRRDGMFSLGCLTEMCP